MQVNWLREPAGTCDQTGNPASCDLTAELTTDEGFEYSAEAGAFAEIGPGFPHFNLINQQPHCETCPSFGDLSAYAEAIFSDALTIDGSRSVRKLDLLNLIMVAR